MNKTLIIVKNVGPNNLLFHRLMRHNKSLVKEWMLLEDSKDTILGSTERKLEMIRIWGQNIVIGFNKYYHHIKSILPYL